jgi:hypothetical protein
MKKAYDIVLACTDINETVIKALEKENSCGGMEAVTVLKLLRGKLDELGQILSKEAAA